MALLLKRRFQPTQFKSFLSSSMNVNIKTILSIIGKSDDVIVRHFSLGANTEVNASILYLDGLVDTPNINFMLSQAMLFPDDEQHSWSKVTTFFEKSGDVVVHKTLDETIEALLKGLTLVFIDKYVSVLSVDMVQTNDRQVDIPSSENIIRGPKQAFVENIFINMSLIRRRIKDQHLRFEPFTFGERTQTKVFVTYITDVIDPAVLTELKTRLNRIDTDAIHTGADLEELIQDAYLTPFPTVYATERPDVVTNHLLDGRIVLIVDGVPFPLVVPAPFVQFIHSAEDYTQRSDIGSLVRLLRFACVFIALLTPSLYVAVTTFHQELIPFNLMVSLAAQSEGTPFPTLAEVLIMEVIFEIIREASIRMPLPAGQALSIVGALVIGTAIVEAGIISSSVVIVVALTAISSFVFPTYAIGIPLRICRFIVLIFASQLGLLGIFLFLMLLLLHLCNLKSFGVPYLEGLSPFIQKEQSDSLIRLPKWLQNYRPRFVPKNRSIRQNTPKPSKRL
ncbi:spore germination protein [Geomicrobium sediminis]|uniref:Spore germination protein KA n=1 Tax=Geomicrobium sediminis TaxID=1347788 RepID=A0ABS2PA30_9BACL|nr:spore germination protein [Geomicrobium sediminis]MBM7631996.1 spore germination protein KA [Geomicrobium sediminis]